MFTENEPSPNQWSTHKETAAESTNPETQNASILCRYITLGLELEANDSGIAIRAVASRLIV